MSPADGSDGRNRPRHRRGTGPIRRDSLGEPERRRPTSGDDHAGGYPDWPDGGAYDAPYDDPGATRRQPRAGYPGDAHPGHGGRHDSPAYGQPYRDDLSHERHDRDHEGDARRYPGGTRRGGPDGHQDRRWPTGDPLYRHPDPYDPYVPHDRQDPYEREDDPYGHPGRREPSARRDARDGGVTRRLPTPPLSLIHITQPTRPTYL
ncbi:MAG: hypothetical protein IRZ08_01745, partial [Frankia sp.]|nr:hypothetical protein [Frankia sp.]